MLDAKLVVVGGDAKSAEVRLKLPTVIGRGKEANLTVPHALVSRRHTEIFEKGGRLFVRDLGSLNGTFVDNHKIDGDIALEPNQLLTLGNITFRAVYTPGEACETIPESETVTFNEIKTEEALPETAQDHVEVEQVDFTETVPVDELKRTDASAPEIVAESAVEELEKVEVEPAAATCDDEAAADTDKSFKTTDATEESISNIFEFEEDSGGKSVALSALEDLPPAQPAAVSFAGKVDFGEDVPAAASHIDPIDIDLGDEKSPKPGEIDSGLGSFLKKLPR